MKTVRCQKCGAIADAEASACPSCGSTDLAGLKAGRPAGVKKPGATTTALAIIGAVGLIVLGGAGWWAAKVFTGGPGADAYDERDAWVECSMQIARASLNPNAADVPSRPVASDEAGFYMGWDQGHGLMLQNEQGAMVQSTAVCAVDRRTQLVNRLDINGQPVIRR